MRRMEACLYVAPGDRTVLERLMASGKTPQKLAVRARIVLLSGRGLGTMAIVTMTAKEKPANATHWSARMLATQVGVGHTTNRRFVRTTVRDGSRQAPDLVERA